MFILIDFYYKILFWIIIILDFVNRKLVNVCVFSCYSSGFRIHFCLLGCSRMEVRKLCCEEHLVNILGFVAYGLCGNDSTLPL